MEELPNRMPYFQELILLVTKIPFSMADHVSLPLRILVEDHLYHTYLECKSMHRSADWTSIQEDILVSSFIHFSLAIGFSSKSLFMLCSASWSLRNKGFQSLFRVAILPPDLGITTTLHYNYLFSCFSLRCEYSFH